jgi:hypothetical protein
MVILGPKQALLKEIGVARSNMKAEHEKYVTETVSHKLGDG